MRGFRTAQPVGQTDEPAGCGEGATVVERTRRRAGRRVERHDTLAASQGERFEPANRDSRRSRATPGRVTSISPPGTFPVKLLPQLQRSRSKWSGFCHSERFPCGVGYWGGDGGGGGVVCSASRRACSASRCASLRAWSASFKACWRSRSASLSACLRSRSASFRAC